MCKKQMNKTKHKYHENKDSICICIRCLCLLPHQNHNYDLSHHSTHNHQVKSTFNLFHFFRLFPFLLSAEDEATDMRLGWNDFFFIVSQLVHFEWKGIQGKAEK